MGRFHDVFALDDVQIPPYLPVLGDDIVRNIMLFATAQR
jgi:hypothetical protein